MSDKIQVIGFIIIAYLVVALLFNFLLGISFIFSIKLLIILLVIGFIGTLFISPTTD